jgi:MFS family permease
VPSVLAKKPAYHPSIIAIAFADFIRGFTRYPLWILISIYLLTVRRLDYIDIGIIFLLQSVFTVPFSIFGGKISDVSGRRGLALLMPILLLFSYLAFFFVVYRNMSIIAVTVIMITISILGNVQYNIGNSILTDLSSESQRLNSFSLVRVTGNLGIGIGLILSGLTAIINPAYFFLAPVFGSLIEIFIIYRYVPESLPSTHEQTGTPKPRFSFRRDRLLILVSLVLAFSALFSNMFESPLLPLYLTSRFSYPEIQITSLYAVNTLIVILFQFRVNALSRKIGEVYTYALGLVIYSASYSVFGLTGIFYILLANVALLTMGENMTSQFSQVFISRIAPPDRRGEYFGYNSAIFSFILPFSPFLGTLILQVLHPYPLIMWSIISAALIVMALISLTLRKHIPSPDRNSQWT